jgi:hypothetical protein
MATTYTTIPFNSGIFFPADAAAHPQGHQEVARTYGLNDVVQLLRPERGLKLCAAQLGWGQLDSNGAPTATATLRSNNGATQQNIMTLSAAQLGAGGTQGFINVPAAIGYIIPARGYWIEILFTAAPATAAAGALYWMLLFSPFAYGDEEITRPPTN